MSQWVQRNKSPINTILQALLNVNRQTHKIAMSIEVCQGLLLSQVSICQDTSFDTDRQSQDAIAFTETGSPKVSKMASRFHFFRRYLWRYLSVSVGDYYLPANSHLVGVWTATFGVWVNQGSCFDGGWITWYMIHMSAWKDVYKLKTEMKWCH